MYYPYRDTLNSGPIKNSRTEENIKCSTTEKGKIHDVCIGITGTCVRPWVNGVFAFLYFLFLFSIKGNRAHWSVTDIFWKKYYKATYWIILLCFYPNSDKWRVVEIYYGCRAAGEERGLDGQQWNYIGSSRRLYIITQSGPSRILLTRWRALGKYFIYYHLFVPPNGII